MSKIYNRMKKMVGDKYWIVISNDILFNLYN